MELTFLACEYIALDDSKNEALKIAESALHRCGAVRRTATSDWYDLPPEPIMAKLPLEGQRHGLTDKLRVVGTAEIIVQRYNAPAYLELDVLSICARAKLDTAKLDTASRQAIWKSLVSKPGTLVLDRNEGVDWSCHEEAMAQASSSGRLREESFNIGLVCSRRAARLGEDIDPSGRRVKRGDKFSASLGQHLHFNGEILEASHLPTSDDLTTLLCQVSARRHILGMVTDALKKITASLPDPPSDLEPRENTDVSSRLLDLENNMRQVQSRLDYLSYDTRGKLAQYGGERMDMEEDLRHWIGQLSHTRHMLSSRLILNTTTMIQQSEESTRNEVTKLTRRIDDLSEAQQTLARGKMKSRRGFVLTEMVLIAAGLTLIGIAGTAGVGTVGIVVAALGSALILVGAFGRELNHRRVPRARELSAWRSKQESSSR